MQALVWSLLEQLTCWFACAFWGPPQFHSFSAPKIPHFNTPLSSTPKNPQFKTKDPSVPPSLVPYQKPLSATQSLVPHTPWAEGFMVWNWGVWYGRGFGVEMRGGSSNFGYTFLIIYINIIELNGIFRSLFSKWTFAYKYNYNVRNFIKIYLTNVIWPIFWF